MNTIIFNADFYREEVAILERTIQRTDITPEQRTQFEKRLASAKAHLEDFTAPKTNTRQPVERRDENGDRIAVIHAYASGDGHLSFVARDPRTSAAVTPAPFEDECRAACPEGFEVYKDGPYWRARKIGIIPAPLGDHERASDVLEIETYHEHTYRVTRDTAEVLFQAWEEWVKLQQDCTATPLHWNNVLFKADQALIARSDYDLGDGPKDVRAV